MAVSEKNIAKQNIEKLSKWPVHGNNRHIESFLIHSIKTNKLSQTYAFFGPSGTGKKELADYFIQSIICDKKDGFVCHKCLNCLQFEKNIHPNIYRISKNDDEKNIGIETMRLMQQKISMSPIGHSHNVALISDAHALTIEAQNSILKTLEEPSKSAIIILVTDFWDELLPTLRSRLLKIRVNVLPKNQLLEILAKEFPNHNYKLLEVAANLSFGKISIARNLITSSQDLESVKSQIELSVNFLKNSRTERLKIIGDIFDKSKNFIDQQVVGKKFANNILAIIDWQLCDFYNVQNAPEDIRNNDKINPLLLSNISSKLFALLINLENNISPKLAFEQFVWNI